tara:strand:- start:144 stop:536 length:393 start_codon:yes stop_codon:yes gene_type:complete
MEGIGQFIPLILIISVVIIVIKFRNKNRIKRMNDFNKKYGTDFKKYEDFVFFEEKEREREWNKFEEQQLVQDLERMKANNIESKKENNKKINKKDADENLGSSLKKLKRMYKDGHLTKVEFEQAKNKLLK